MSARAKAARMVNTAGHEYRHPKSSNLDGARFVVVSETSGEVALLMRRGLRFRNGIEEFITVSNG
jgi:hypothetical protein